MREQFAAWYPPSPEQRREFITAGLVVLDANVLLDLYRMNTDAREDVLGLLRRLGDRLWIPHQVAQEFHRNRLNVIHDQEQILKKIRETISDSVHKLTESVNNVRDHPIINRESLASVITESFDHINSYLDTLCREPILSIKTAMDADPVLDTVTTLLTGKVGPPYTRNEMPKIEADGRQRIKDERPPGYADAKKDGNRALGDYILWRQVLDEANKRKLPTLMVTNDQKEDWYLRLHGITIGPQPQLIDEMLEEAGVPFHAQTLARFISTASATLQSAVKETTVTEVSRLNEADRTAAQLRDAEALLRKLQRSVEAVELRSFRGKDLTIEGPTAESDSLSNRARELEILHNHLLRQEGELRAMLEAMDPTTQPDADVDDPRSYIRTLEAQLAQTLARIAEVKRERQA